MDFLLAAVAIILLSPVLFLVTLLVNAKIGHPVLFKQKTPGLH